MASAPQVRRVAAAAVAAAVFGLGPVSGTGVRPPDPEEAKPASAQAPAAAPQKPAQPSTAVDFVRSHRPDLLDENPSIRERMARYWYFLLYPTGTLPDRPWDRAREHVERHVPDAPPWKLEGAPLRGPRPSLRQGLAVAPAVVAPGSSVWVEYGPRPLDSTGTTNNAFQYGIVSGRLNAIVSDPTDRGAGKGDRAWLGYASGGLWRLDGVRSVTCSAGVCDTSGVVATSLWDDRDQATQAISAIEIDPNDPTGNTLYVGTGDWQANDQFSAGIHKTTDGGATWTALGADVFTPYSNALPPDEANGGCVGCQGSRYSNQNVKAIEAVPGTATVLVGTRSDLYLSNDGGVTWQICPFGNFQTNPEATVGGLNGINRISGIHLDTRSSPARAYVAVGYVIRSNVDSGGGNTVVENANNGVYSFLVPASGCPAWPAAFTTHFDGLPAGTGTAAAGSKTGRIELAGVVAADSRLTLYAQVADSDSLDVEGTWVLRPDDPTWTDANGNGVKDWRVIASPGSYTTCSGGGSTTGQDWYDLHVAVNPVDDRQLYIGHVDLFKGTVNAGYTSLTLGNAANLSNVYATGCSSYGKVHPDQHSFAFVELGTGDPNYGTWVLVGNDGGIYLNTAGGDVSSWASLSRAGISSNQFYAGQIGMNFAGTDGNGNGTLEPTEYGNPVDNRQWLLGGMQDNGCASWDSSRSDLQWTARGWGGDGMWTAFDSLGGTETSGYWLTESQGGNVNCSNSGADGPVSACSPAWAGNFSGQGLCTSADPPGCESPDWSTPVFMDQLHCTATQCRNTLVAGDHVYASTAYGTPAWTRTTGSLSAGLPGRTNDGNGLRYADGSVVAINMARTNPGGVVAGTDNGRLWWSGNVFTGASCTQAAANSGSFSCTANASATWEPIDAANAVLPNRVVAGVAFAPDTDQVLYAAIAGFGANTPATPGHVYRAVRSGANSWTVQDKSGNLPDVPFMTVAVNPHNPGQVFAGSLWGFFYTDDVTVASPVWFRYMEGLPNAPIFLFSIDRGPQSAPLASTTLAAFTYGRGVYAIKLPGAGQSFCQSKPLAPGSVAAQVTSANVVTVTWVDSVTPGVTQYRVYRGTSPSGPFLEIGTVIDGSPGVGGSGSYAFPDATVSGGTTYHYVVRAYNGECGSLDSAAAAVVATGDCVLPPAFAGATSVSQLSGGQGCGLRVSWAVGAPSCGASLLYNVYRSTTSGFAPAPSNLLASCVAGSSYDDTTTATGTQYHYVVRAEDPAAAGTGACGGGAADGNTVQRSGQVSASGTQTLYSNDFSASASDWVTVSFGGSGDSWRGIQSCAGSVMRFGGAGCTDDYGDGHFIGRKIGGAGGIAIPGGTTTTRLGFNHRWEFELGNGNRHYDGATLAVSLNGTNYTIVPASALIAGPTYTGTIHSGAQSCPPTGAGGLPVWGGTSTGFASSQMQAQQVNLDAVCTAISGGSCAGQTVHVAFLGITDCGIGADGWFLDDVAVTVINPAGACSAAPQPVAFFTTTSKDTQVTAQWLNPGTYSGPTRICRSTSAFAADPGASACPSPTDVAGSASTPGSTTFTGLTNGQPQHLAAFVNAGGAYSGRRTVTGLPFATTSAAKWSFAATAATLAPPLMWPGIGVFASSNDRSLHGMQSSGVAAGTWPVGWKPVGMNGPAQGQPLVLPALYTGFATAVVLGSSQDGHVYCAKVTDGSGCDGWGAGGRSATLPTLQANAMLYYDATPANRLLIVATRTSAGTNGLYALTLANGTVAAGWPFVNSVAQGGDGQAIGISSAPVFVDAAARVAYFTTRARAGGSANTVWAVSFSSGTPQLLWARALGDVDGAVTHDWTSNRLLVGTLSGGVHALDPATGSTVWSRAFADGPVKDFIYYHQANSRLYFSSTTKVWSIPASGATGSDWVVNATAPSRPLLQAGTPRVYVGACGATCADGRVLELDSASAWASPKSYDVTGAGGFGGLTIDRGQSPAVAFAGSRSGRVYAVQLPLP